MKVGPYEVVGELGRGGMGVVVRGRAADGAEVAIKLLPRGRLSAALPRFERERRLQEDLSEVAGFVPLLASGDSPSGPYLVMPLLTGGTLRDRLTGSGIPASEAAPLVRALATALGRAHKRGIVHRDLKPENVLFTGGGRPLVADLGLAKHFREDVTGASQTVNLSRSGEARGTVGYMAPEQLHDSRRAGPPADVFALGTVLYECLSGRPAFSGGSAVELVAKIATGEVEPLSAIQPETPRWLVDVVERAMHLDPAARYADGGALARALSVGARGHRVGSGGRRWVLLPVGALAILVVATAYRVHARRPANEPTPAAAPAAAPEPSPPSGPRGWRGEPLPDRLRRGPVEPALVWDTGHGFEIELVWVSPGPFLAGSDDPQATEEERPRRTLTLERGMWIGRHDTTWADVRRFREATGRASQPLPAYWNVLVEPKESHPVVNISFDEARAFCEWVGLRLPFQDEWEKAARGDDGRRWPFGDAWDGTRVNACDASSPSDNRHGDKNLDDAGLRDPSVWDGFPYTSPSGSFPASASPCGALDMAGNVWQWCAVRDDPFRPVARGGSWSDPSRECQAWRRDRCDPGLRGNALGFRPALGS